jgi:lysophospholipase L1-like esterase
MFFLFHEPPRQWRGRNALRAWSYAVGILLVAGVLCTTVIACDGGSAASVNAPDSVTVAGPDRPQEAGSTPPGDSRDHQAVTQQAYPTIVNQTGISATGQTARSGQGVTAIGDSMLIGVAPYLEDLLPGIVIDGQVGRQLAEGQAVVAQLKEQGRLGSRVIIQLGNNGPFSQDQLRSLLNSLGQTQQVVMVNTRVPRPWQDSVNQTIAQIAADDPRVTLVNWFLASEGKSYLFYSDGVHLQPDGYQYYASLLANAVQPAAPPAGSGTTSSQ